MKNHHKLFIAASLLAAGQSAIAADSVVDVFGKVRAALSITNLSDPADTNSAATVVNFGALLPETGSTELSSYSLVDTTSGCPVSTATDVAGALGFAKITYSGDSGAKISLSAPVTNTDGNMTFTPAAYMADSSSCTAVETTELDTNFSAGTATFYLGGTMDTAGAANGELFDKTVTVTVSY